MNNDDITFNILALDSIYGVLRWEDRIDLRLYIQGRLTNADNLSDKVWAVRAWIISNDWNPPHAYYDKDHPTEDGLRIKTRFGSMTVKEYVETFPINSELKNLIIEK